MARPIILLVDDTELFLEVEKDFLREQAVTVYTAANGREALDILTVVRPDLIFIDLHMPVMDGAECCAVIKTDPDLRSIPVVIVSVANDPYELERCRLAGSDGLLVTPVSRDRFLEYGRKFLPEIEKIEVRVPCQTQVILRLNNQPLYATGIDLSGHGMYLAFNGDVEVEDRVSVNFLLPGGEMELIQASGRVAWVNRGGNLVKPLLPAGFGIEFDRLSEEHLTKIKKYIRDAEQKGACMRIQNAYFMMGSI